jgi:hypothetical protein
MRGIAWMFYQPSGSQVTYQADGSGNITMVAAHGVPLLAGGVDPAQVGAMLQMGAILSSQTPFSHVR